MTSFVQSQRTRIYI